MLNKSTALTLIVLIFGCQSEDKLIGDSNVYLDPSEVPDASNENQPDGGTCLQGNELEVQSFQASPAAEDDSSEPNPSDLGALSCGIDGHAITLKHNNVAAHCDQNWSDIQISTEEEYRIKISYGFEPVEAADCTYDLEYTIDMQNCDLPAGVYQIIAHGSEAEVDLSDVLGENNTETTD